MYYVFGTFQLDPVKRTLSRNGGRVRITTKALEMLLALVNSHGTILTKEELTGEVWGAGITVTDNNFNVTLRAVRKALGESGRDPQYIVTSSDGYSFISKVQEVRDESGSVDGPKEEDATQGTPGTTSSPIDANIELPFGGYRFHVLSACFQYACLYGLALLTEVAYKFDQYRSAALKVTVLVVCWIFLTSVIAMACDWRWTVQGRSDALVRSVIIFLVAAAILFGVLCFFLPATPITEATFQTHTAQAAYLKDIGYLIPLVLLFLITPFHFVITMQREIVSGRDRLINGLLSGNKSSVPPRGTIYFKTWVLVLMLLLLATYFLIARARLLDNLSPGPHMNLFENLIQVRLVLYFVLGVQCVAWYHRALAELKRASLIVRLK